MLLILLVSGKFNAIEEQTEPVVGLVITGNGLTVIVVIELVEEHPLEVTTTV